MTQDSKEKIKVCELNEFATIINKLGVNQEGKKFLIENYKFNKEIINGRLFKRNYEVVFKNCYFDKSFCSKSMQNNIVIFEKCKFHDIEIRGENIELSFYDLQCQSFKCFALNSSILISVGKITNMQIGGGYNKYDMTMVKINTLELLNKKFNNPCILAFALCKIKSLFILGEYENKTRFFLCKMDIINFSEFSNLGFLSFNYNKPISNSLRMNLEHTNLDDVIFWNCQLQKYQFILECSDLSKAVFNNCSNIDDKENQFIINIGERVFYKQLKSSAKLNNDFVSYLYYRSKELDAYRRELKKEKGFLNGDRIILFLSRISNYYGFRWTWAVVFILLIAATFFSIALITLDNWPLEFCLNNCNNPEDAFSLISKNFINFLNPTHSLSIFDNYSPNGWTYIWDMLGRIFIGFGIYQLIKAFRKFVL